MVERTLGDQIIASPPRKPAGDHRSNSGKPSGPETASGNPEPSPPAFFRKDGREGVETRRAVPLAGYYGSGRGKGIVQTANRLLRTGEYGGESRSGMKGEVESSILSSGTIFERIQLLFVRTIFIHSSGIFGYCMPLEKNFREITEYHTELVL